MNKVSANTDAPVDTVIRTTVETFDDTMITTFYNEPVETLTNTSVSKSIDTLVNTSVNTPVIDTPITTSINTAVDSAAGKSINTDKPSEKIFLLPSYTFHLLFLAACAALIAATLYFFLTRRNRDDSRRFLTTTRLSVLDKLVQRGCRHIESNYPDPALTPETVCNSLVTGKAYLDALFMNELGINVQDFITQVRVNAIKNRVSAPLPPQQQSLDINEICAECGFADRTEAERCFAAICGGVGIADFARFSKMQNQRR
ncbi:MAG: helix-turn-helix domain-containing protein [Chitinispirillales bacterium]|nr:helix-turn-helix domain-containing protein [Chitinispirillales bacterium]